ncbi:hypothetical protein MMC25_003657 [Agyrium rufum]|nr:hypothetical protein [Agyrium rufum]
MGLFEKLQSRLEIYRLEQRYARRKGRNVFTSDARYVDGEYIYSSASKSPSSSSYSTNFSNTSSKNATKIETWEVANQTEELV